MDEFAETPHKKWGKNHDKSSPNMKGCPENHGNEHVYVKIVQWWRWNAETPWRGYPLSVCLGCGRRGNRKTDKKVKDHETYADVVKRSDDYYVLEMHNGKPYRVGVKLWK